VDVCHSIGGNLVQFVDDACGLQLGVLATTQRELLDCVVDNLGQLVEQGPVEQVLARPQHDYTKRLMADVPLLRGKQTMHQWASVEALDASGA
jgi:ABC-type dipeptide/oligopeptide/nickel transport system ATPase component